MAGNIVSGKQLFLNIPTSSNKSGVSTSSTVYAVSNKDQATKAGLIQAMKVVVSSYSYASCDGIEDVFQAMFPDAVPDNFTISSSKVSYLVSDATGPYFHNLLVSDVKASCTPYTLQYDETTNKQVEKQLDINICLWSVAQNQVIVYHLKTVLLGHATGNILSKEILKALADSELPLNMLLVLGMTDLM